MAKASPKTPRITGLFILPPQVIARLGASDVALDNYVWEEDPSISGAARTVIEPAVTLDVADDGSVHPFLPENLRFKDGGLFRPVAPFLEVWVTIEDGTQSSEQPLTSELLEQLGASLQDLTFTIEAANLKAARRCGDANCRFQSRFEVVGDDHQRHSLLASTVELPEGGDPLVSPDRPIPLGFFQVLRPVKASRMGINLDTVRVRFTPAAGEVYGPPSAKEGVPPGRRLPHLIVKPENRILNPKAAWTKYDADPDRFFNPEPSDTYDGADVPKNRSLGVVDDTCEAVIEVQIKLGKQTLTAQARVFVSPPDFAPDRRPFMSLADDLADRDLSVPAVGEQLEDFERRINDLFLRALETASLFNLDAVRDRALGDNGRSSQIPNFPRTDRGSMTGEDEPYAVLTAVAFPDRKSLAQASTKREPLPLTDIIEQAHTKLADLDLMVTKLREEAERIELMLRPPFGRLRELAAKPQGPSKNHRDPRVERDLMHDMRMPPFMRDSDANPLSLTHRQYTEVLELVNKLAAEKKSLTVQWAQFRASRGMLQSAGQESGTFHPALLDTPSRRRVSRFIQQQQSIRERDGLAARTSGAFWALTPQTDRSGGKQQTPPAPASSVAAGKIFPLNLTAKAAVRVAGNPESTRLESGVGNCFPGLEFDHRNLDRRFLPGLLVEFVSSGEGSVATLQGCRVLQVDLEDPGLMPSELASDDEVAACARLRSDLRAHQQQLFEGSWFVTALAQGGRRIELFSDDDLAAPLDAMTAWRLVRSLEPAAVEIELRQRKKQRNQPSASPIILHGWRRRFTDPVSGVISSAYQPGELTQSLCSPWTHDFRDCACIYWASNHPDVVHLDDPNDPVLSGGSSANPDLGLLRVDWLRSDRSASTATAARPTEGQNRPKELDHYEINQRWQELSIVLGDKEIPAVYQPRSQDSAAQFANPNELASKLTELATLEHVLILEYLYAYYSLLTPSEISDGPLAEALRDDVEFIRHFVQLVAVNEMQHLRLANQLLWELAESSLIDRSTFGPSLGVAQTIPDSNQPGPGPHPRAAALRPLELPVLRDFVAVERPSATIEGEYARVVATLRQPQYPDSLYQLASRIVNEGQDHFLRFSEIEAVMLQYEKDASPTPWLRDFKLASKTDPDVKSALDTYAAIIQALNAAYLTGSITDRRHVISARDKMLELDGICLNLAQKQNKGVPFF